MALRSNELAKQTAPAEEAPAPGVAAKTAPRIRRRRTQEERSREAQERLLRATIDVLLERGYNGLTTKEAAARAGLSTGALVHHYAAKADLVVAATAAVYDAATERGERIARTAAARKNPLQGFIDDCSAVYLDWPFLAALEVLVVARTDLELMRQIEPVMRNYRAVTNARWMQALREAGTPEAKGSVLLDLTLNLVRGMGVNSLWQKDLKNYKALLREWTRIAGERLVDLR